MSVMEMSHRGKEFISIIQKAESDLRTLLNISGEYADLFLQVCAFLSNVSVVPPAAALVIKALKEPEHDMKNTKNIKHNGNISLDVVIEITKVIQPRSMAQDFSGTVKEILGTYVSVGCTVDGKDTKDLQQDFIVGDVEIPQD
ncbi:hypothetical protein EJD97_003218 [Solanum chilense]|uniref:Large ribosomal subunit protein uL11 C-terminal domain-containing protein n=1 Tax=Solanum chilense TaxID=4083 RepID=A0A6N2APE0_SOLCI|nr:hypothetical protein EJD97_003218 [Solanum chilense]